MQIGWIALRPDEEEAIMDCKGNDIPDTPSSSTLALYLPAIVSGDHPPEEGIGNEKHAYCDA